MTETVTVPVFNGYRLTAQTTGILSSKFQTYYSDDPYTEQPGYARLDARISFDSPGGRWGVGDSVVTVAVARIGNEEFQQGGHLAEGVVTTKEFSEYCAGKTIAYVGAWRYYDGWQMYDHRPIGSIGGYDR